MKLCGLGFCHKLRAISEAIITNYFFIILKKKRKKSFFFILFIHILTIRPYIYQLYEKAKLECQRFKKKKFLQKICRVKEQDI